MSLVEWLCSETFLGTGPPGWGLGIRLTTIPCKSLSSETSKKSNNRFDSTQTARNGKGLENWNACTLFKGGALKNRIDVFGNYGIDILAIQEIRWLGHAARRLEESNLFEFSKNAFKVAGSIAFHHLSCYLTTLDLNTLSNLNIPFIFLELIGNKCEFIFPKKTPKKISGNVPYRFVTTHAKRKPSSRWLDDIEKELITSRIKKIGEKSLKIVGAGTSLLLRQPRPTLIVGSERRRRCEGLLRFILRILLLYPVFQGFFRQETAIAPEKLP
ncbi:hypothetical protein TNCV_626851 [Trichonephila clavipes]|nr:hypothetical protein TNCV_626851 [Trichonephila clavipes]